MNTMQLFELHMKVNNLPSRLTNSQQPKESDVCKLCGLPITEESYPIKGLITDTFTDLEIWRRSDSFVLCHACACTIRDGFNKGRSEGFAAVMTDGGLVSQFSWNTAEMPWFRLPEGAPNVLVFPGRSYMQKHRLFRAEACQDENYISFWHGDIGQYFVPRHVARQIRALEDEWMANGYPTKKDMGKAVRDIMAASAADLIGHTINLIENRRKAHQKGE